MFTSEDSLVFKSSKEGNFSEVFCKLSKERKKFKCPKRTVRSIFVFQKNNGNTRLFRFAILEDKNGNKKITKTIKNTGFSLEILEQIREYILQDEIKIDETQMNLCF